MNRRIRNLVIAAASVLVLTALVIVLLQWTPPEDDASQSPSPTPEEAFSLLETDGAAVENVRLTPNEGQSFTITLADNAYTMRSADTLFPDDISKLSASFASAYKLSGLKRIAENADSAALASFGLDSPAVVWRVEMKDGTAHEFALGKPTVTESGYYIRRAGDKDVYLLPQSAGKNLEMPREGYYKLGFLPAELLNSTESNVTWNQLDVVRLEQSGRVLDFDKLDDAELTAPGADYFSSYRMNEPHDASISEASFSTDFMIPVTTVNPSEIITLDPQDLGVYGLDQPDRLTVGDLNGWKATLLIGGTDPESGGRYVMHEGKDAVLLDTKGDYSFLQAEEYKLRLHSLWLYSIDTVDSVDFMLDGVSRHLEIGFDAETKDCNGALDGVSLSSANTKRLYRTALDLLSSENYFGELPTAAPRYSITIHFADGRSSTADLIPINERQYAAVLNGKNMELLVYHSTIRQVLLDYFDMIDRGENIA